MGEPTDQFGDAVLELAETVTNQTTRQSLSEHRAKILRAFGRTVAPDQHCYLILWLTDRYPKDEERRRCTAWVVTSESEILDLTSLDDIRQKKPFSLPSVDFDNFAAMPTRDVEEKLSAALEESMIQPLLKLPNRVRSSSRFYPVKAHRLDLNFLIPRKDPSMNPTETIGYVQVIGSSIEPRITFDQACKLLKVWGNAIQNERKMRAMDGLEKFVQSLRRKLELEEFVETACGSIQEIVNCSRVFAFKREFNHDNTNSTCLWDTQNASRRNDLTILPGQIVHDQFDMTLRAPGTHVARVIDVSDEEELKAHFKAAQLDESDLKSGYVEKHAGMMIVCISAPINGRSGNSSKTVLLLKLISVVGAKNIGGTFSETEQYIVAAAAQYIAARLPWLLFKRRLDELKKPPTLVQTEPGDGLSGTDDTWLTEFADHCTQSIDFISKVCVVKDEQMFPQTPVPKVVLPLSSELSDDEISEITSANTAEINTSKGANSLFCYARIASDQFSSAWAAIFVESSELTEQDFELVEYIISDLSRLWHVQRGVGEERRKSLERGHSVISTLSAGLDNIELAHDHFMLSRELSPEDAYHEIFVRPQMRRTLTDGKFYTDLTRGIFQADRLTKSKISRSDLEIINLNLPKTIGHLVKIFNKRADRRGIKINVVGEYNESYPLIFADRILIVVAMMNILDNAVKHSFRGNRVEIRYGYRKNYRWFFQVENEGIHIPEGMIDNLMMLGIRQGTPKGYHYRAGQGLGLAITNRILKAHEENATVKITSLEHSQFENNASITVGFELGTGSRGKHIQNNPFRR